MPPPYEVMKREREGGQAPSGVAGQPAGAQLGQVQWVESRGSLNHSFSL